MRFKFNRNNNGDTKIKRKFLWFPTWIDSECRWLEYATIEYVYTKYWCEQVLIGHWYKLRFIDDNS